MTRTRRAPRRWAWLALAPAVALALGGCSSDLATPGEALRVVGAGLPPAYQGEPYEEPIHAVGGLRPYGFALADGTLPPGLTLENGTLRGTPTETGAYPFTVEVTDANLSKTVQRYTLTVLDVPPPRLVYDPPLTEVQRRITLHVRLEDARHLDGIRSVVRWDATRFRLVDGSVTPARRALALFEQHDDGELQVAIAPLGSPLDGGLELFRFDLEPIAGASTVELTARTEASSQGRHDFATTREGRAPSPAPAGGGTGLPGTPPAGGPAGGS